VIALYNDVIKKSLRKHLLQAFQQKLEIKLRNAVPMLVKKLITAVQVPLNFFMKMVNSFSLK